MGKRWIAVASGVPGLLFGVVALMISDGDSQLVFLGVLLLLSGSLATLGGISRWRRGSVEVEPILLPEPLAWFLLAAAVVLLAIGALNLLWNPENWLSSALLLAFVPFAAWVCISHIRQRRRARS